MKTFVVGDIHGAYLALAQVLERSEFNYENDTLISLGDIADGKPQTFECVEELLKIKNLIAIRGNHDIWLKDWLNDGTAEDIWLRQGGKASIQSYKGCSEGSIEKHRTFFNNQVDWYIDDENRLFIHAGWDYMAESFKTGATILKNDNLGKGAMECHWNRTLCYSARDNKWFGVDDLNFLDEFHEIFIGHTQTQTLKPFHKFNIWNLDTGAGWNGVLTLLELSSKEIWQSDKVTEFYGF